MVKRKLDGTVDESSADHKIRKSHGTVHNLRKIWRPAPSSSSIKIKLWEVQRIKPEDKYEKCVGVI